MSDRIENKLNEYKKTYSEFVKKEADIEKQNTIAETNIANAEKEKTELIKKAKELGVSDIAKLDDVINDTEKEIDNMISDIKQKISDKQDDDPIDFGDDEI